MAISSEVEWERRNDLKLLHTELIGVENELADTRSRMNALVSDVRIMLSRLEYHESAFTPFLREQIQIVRNRIENWEGE